MPDPAAGITPDSKRIEWAKHVAVHAAFVLAISLVGLKLRPGVAWPLMAIGTFAWFLTVGYLHTGQWVGILIDNRNRVSLSRAQMVVWSIVLLTGFGAAALHNVSAKAADPLKIGIPQEMWLLMGISVASLVGSPLLLQEREKKGNHLARNSQATAASVKDMVSGESEKDVAHVDLAKLQMGFFTVIVVLAYCSALGRLFADTLERTAIKSLPGLDNGLLALMGISHTGYLASKPMKGGSPVPEAFVGGVPLGTTAPTAAAPGTSTQTVTSVEAKQTVTSVKRR